MRNVFVTILLVCCGLRLDGQTIAFKPDAANPNGKVLVTKGIRRLGDNIMATESITIGANTTTGEIGYPLKSIDKVNFPEPPQIKASNELLLRGSPDQALAQ